ncbi:unnamed protein product [Enterobius vermicularis]|uniref:LAM_G_DOMAIN domain-containing protein n=1 Tax=Enterobius vermicularis TaxID=51028 RepID=A0A0N4VQG5_ENTVE|nr:unnamed protein product [Enterobius vermicularis]
MLEKIASRLECEDHTFNTLNVDLGYVHLVQKVAIIAPFSIYQIQTEITKDQTTRNQLKSLNNSPLVVYSSLDFASAEHVTLNTIARKIFFVPVYKKDLPHSPVVLITVCRYDSPINYFNDNPYTVYTREVGLVSSFDNQLDIVFRTYENGIFIFSMHDEGDLLVVQIVDGTIYVIYDFGTLSHSVLSGGVALNDGEWHEIRWTYNYDKVELIIDGALMNSTTPLGYAKRLDLDDQVSV